jgi:hypothetical protein
LQTGSPELKPGTTTKKKKNLQRKGIFAYINFLITVTKHFKETRGGIISFGSRFQRCQSIMVGVCGKVDQFTPWHPEAEKGDS